jgi:tetratricopeptide (TPR) repeat protein
LEQCLAADPDYAPAFLLYPRVAEYNTRAKDRNDLITLFERFLPSVDAAVKGTRAYDYIKKNIEGMGGNCFDKVERHLADYHCDLAVLYKQTGQIDLAKTEYKKAGKLCPKIYGRGTMKIKLQL